MGSRGGLFNSFRSSCKWHYWGSNGRMGQELGARVWSMWIKDAELNTGKPSGKVEEAQDTYVQGHDPRISIAPLSENLYYY